MPAFVFPPSLKKLLQGNPFGDVVPDRTPPVPPPFDGRTAALELLREYVAALTFYRAGDAKAPFYGFKIPQDRIHVEWPDAEENITDLPVVVFKAQDAPATFSSLGLGSWVDDDSRNEFGKGTVVQHQSEYVETFLIEVLCDKRPQRRAVLAGLARALVPTEQLYGLRFTMPAYYNQLACFTLFSRSISDREDDARGRRIGRLLVELRYHEVALVTYEPMIVSAVVNVDFNPASPASKEKVALSGGPESPLDPNGDRVAHDGRILSGEDLC